MKILGKRLVQATMFAAATVAFSATPESPAIGAEFVAIKGGQVGGAYNRWTSAWSVYLSNAMDGYQFSSESSTGSGENVRTVSNGGAEMGMAFASDVYLGYRGEGDFTEPLENLRALSFMFASVGHLLVPVDSEITTIEDLRGERISFGGPGSGSAKNLTLLLEHLGIMSDVTAVYLGGKSPQAMRNGEIAGYNWHPGLGNAMIRDTATMMDIRFIDMDAPAKASGFYDAYPYFGTQVIPAGLYNNVDVDTNTFGTGTLFISSSDVSADLVYNVLKTLDSEEGRSEMATSVGQASIDGWTKDVAFDFVTIPLHEGAQRFWEEKGAMIPSEVMAK